MASWIRCLAKLSKAQALVQSACKIEDEGGEVPVPSIATYLLEARDSLRVCVINYHVHVHVHVHVKKIECVWVCGTWVCRPVCRGVVYVCILFVFPFQNVAWWRLEPSVGMDCCLVLWGFVLEFD